MSPTILIHSSKTMRAPKPLAPPSVPQLVGMAEPLGAYLQTLTTDQLQRAMQISGTLSVKVQATIAEWSVQPKQQSLAIDSFVGDIYSGLQVHTWSAADREYAQQSLRILSGLYGILRPNDGVRPYRLEMGYRLPDKAFANLYAYWGGKIADTLPKSGLIVNLSAAEYTKTVLPYVDTARVIAPRFLTINPKTGQPSQVIVHTKIARGAFAKWLVQGRYDAPEEMTQFGDLGYRYDPSLSTATEPTFFCKQFGGIGLSVRLNKG